MDPSSRGLSDRDQEFARAVRRLALVMHRYLSYVGRDRYGLDPSGGAAIVALHSHGPLTPSQIARMINLTQAATTEVLDRLDRAGHITRSPHPTDRRKIIVQTTPAADELNAREWETFSRLLSPPLHDHDDSTQDLIIKAVGEAISALEKANEAGR